MNIKTKEEVVSRLCKLSTLVMQKHFKYQESADCFCDSSGNLSFSFSEDVIDFIEQAVKDKMNVVSDNEPQTKTYFYRVIRCGATETGTYDYTLCGDESPYQGLINRLDFLYGAGQYTLACFNPL